MHTFVDPGQIDIILDKSNEVKDEIPEYSQVFEIPSTEPLEQQTPSSEHPVDPKVQVLPHQQQSAQQAVVIPDSTGSNRLFKQPVVGTNNDIVKENSSLKHIDQCTDMVLPSVLEIGKWLIYFFNINL